MYPYLPILSQRAIELAQRIAASPAGQRASALAERGADALRRFETKWPTLPRNAQGYFPSRSAADKIPLAPLSRGAAGGLGVYGVLNAPTRPEAPAPEPSSVPASVWQQLTRQEAEAARPIHNAPGMGMEPGGGPDIYSAPGMGMEPDGGPDDVAIRAARAAVQRSTSAPNGSPAPALPPQRPDSPAPLPPQRPTSAVQDAWARYNETGSPADFIRASNLMRDNAPQAEARGGSIKAKGEPKPDPVHKALEIIHHLLIHGR
jgi:hypothetical protein